MFLRGSFPVIGVARTCVCVCVVEYKTVLKQYPTVTGIMDVPSMIVHAIPPAVRYAYHRVLTSSLEPLHLAGNSDTTIVLIHGFAAEHTDLREMGIELHRRTGHTVRAVDLCVDRLAVMMDVHNTAEIIAHQLARTVTGQVVLVCHSFGGLVGMEVTRIWSQYPHLFQGLSCGGLCTIATPQPGSLYLDRAMFSASCNALLFINGVFPPLIAMLDFQRVKLLWDHARDADYPLVVVEGANDWILAPSPEQHAHQYTLVPTGTHTSLLLPDYDMHAVCDALVQIL